MSNHYLRALSCCDTVEDDELSDRLNTAYRSRAGCAWQRVSAGSNDLVCLSKLLLTLTGVQMPLSLVLLLVNRS